MVIDVVNLDNVIQKFENAQELDYKPFIQKSTQLVQRTAKAMCPVDTGHLRRNINRKTERYGETGVVGKVFNTVEYAPYQEFGTSRMNAQPFMYPAMRQHEKDILNGLEDILSRKFRRL